MRNKVVSDIRDARLAGEKRDKWNIIELWYCF